MDDLALFLATVDPVGIERELLGDPAAAAHESFARLPHKQMVQAHSYLADQYWSMRGGAAVARRIEARRQIDDEIEDQIREYARKKRAI